MATKVVQTMTESVEDALTRMVSWATSSKVTEANEDEWRRIASAVYREIASAVLSKWPAITRFTMWQVVALPLGTESVVIDDGHRREYAPVQFSAGQTLGNDVCSLSVWMVYDELGDCLRVIRWGAADELRRGE